MKILFPELVNNPIAQAASEKFPEIEFLRAENLEEAVERLSQGQADALISGLDYTSRDVLIAFKNHLPLKSQFFSSCFICERPGQHLTLADGGVNKMPNPEQLYAIVEDSARTHEKYFGEQPIIAMLSYSTKGSGGKNPDLEKIYYVIERIKTEHPEWIIDGEMQLDAAIEPAVAAKKTPGSPVNGQANLLITPDLNSGNILYKALERFGGFICAGPIVQGYYPPLADLSRGSTVEDVCLTIKVLKKLGEA